MKNEKKRTAEDIELPNKDIFRMLWKENYEYLFSYIGKRNPKKRVDEGENMKIVNQNDEKSFWN